MENITLSANFVTRRSFVSKKNQKTYIVYTFLVGEDILDIFTEKDLGKTKIGVPVNLVLTPRIYNKELRFDLIEIA